MITKILALLILCALQKKCDSRSYTLELVHVLFRHGHRTPDKNVTYPTDPHFNVSYNNIGYGQLTNVGKQASYMLGQALHKRYKKFLGPYVDELIEARSTDYKRTKVSLQLVLAALFPPEGDQIWSRHLNWQPIPFEYFPLRNDHVLGEPYRNCLRHKQLYLDYLKSPEAIDLYEKYRDVANYLEKHARINATSRSIFTMYFTLLIQREFNLVLPEWTKPIFPEPLKQLVYLEYNSRSATPELKKLSSGYFLKKIVQNTNKKIKNVLPPERKMFLYSGHELNIVYFLHGLGVFDPHVPAYAAYVLIEIYKIEEDRYIQILYQNYSSKYPRFLKIPGCSSPCNFKEFVHYYKKYFPKNSKECDL